MRNNVQNQNIQNDFIFYDVKKKKKGECQLSESAQYGLQRKL